MGEIKKWLAVYSSDGVRLKKIKGINILMKEGKIYLKIRNKVIKLNEKLEIRKHKNLANK